MGHVERASLLFIAASIAVAGLYYLRDIITPFVLAIFVWLIMDGFARALRSRLSFLSYPVALMIVILFLLGVLFFAGGLLRVLFLISSTIFRTIKPVLITPFKAFMNALWGNKMPPNWNSFSARLM